MENRNSKNRILWNIVFAALVLAAGLVRSYRYAFESLSVQYTDFSALAAVGGGAQHFANGAAEGYFYLLKGSFYLLGNRVEPLIYVQWLLAFIFACLLWGSCRRIFGNLPALLGVAAWAFTPRAMEYESALTPTLFYLVCLSLSLLFLSGLFPVGSLWGLFAVFGGLLMGAATGADFTGFYLWPIIFCIAFANKNNDFYEHPLMPPFLTTLVSAVVGFVGIFVLRGVLAGTSPLTVLGDLAKDTFLGGQMGAFAPGTLLFGIYGALMLLLLLLRFDQMDGVLLCLGLGLLSIYCMFNSESAVASGAMAIPFIGVELGLVIEGIREKMEDRFDGRAFADKFKGVKVKKNTTQTWSPEIRLKSPKARAKEEKAKAAALAKAAQEKLAKEQAAQERLEKARAERERLLEERALREREAREKEREEKEKKAAAEAAFMASREVRDQENEARKEAFGTYKRPEADAEGEAADSVSENVTETADVQAGAEKAESAVEAAAEGAALAASAEDAAKAEETEAVKAEDADAASAEDVEAPKKSFKERRAERKAQREQAAQEKREAKEAAAREKAEAKEAAARAKQEAKEAAIRAKQEAKEAKEAAKREKLEAKEAAKRAKLEAKEAAEREKEEAAAKAEEEQRLAEEAAEKAQAEEKRLAEEAAAKAAREKRLAEEAAEKEKAEAEAKAAEEQRLAEEQAAKEKAEAEARAAAEAEERRLAEEAAEKEKAEAEAEKARAKEEKAAEAERAKQEKAEAKAKAAQDKKDAKTRAALEKLKEKERKEQEKLDRKEAKARAKQEKHAKRPKGHRNIEMEEPWVPAQKISEDENIPSGLLEIPLPMPKPKTEKKHMDYDRNDQSFKDYEPSHDRYQPGDDYDI